MIVHRHKNGKDDKGKLRFKYKDSRGRLINDDSVIEKIKRIPIPPAYVNVVIDLKNGAKVFAKGYDVAGRRQYIYNPDYVKKQDANKYCNLIKFGKKLPEIKRSVDRMIHSKVSKERIMGLVLRIIMQCNFRVGNEVYKKKHKSFGISTIEANHVQIKGENKANIKFIGKKGVLNECMVRNGVLVDQLRELIDKRGKGSGKPLFMYKEGRELKRVCAIEINNYLKKFGPFTSKSFRTWEANTVMLKRLLTVPVDGQVTKRKKKVTNMIKEVAIELHHTPAICRRSYLIPNLLDLYVQHPTKFAVLKKSFKSGKELGEVLIDYLKSIC